MIPGLEQQLGDVDVDEQQLGRVEAIVLSMTPLERAKPIVIDGKRRLRHRPRLRHDGRAGEPAARGAQADGEDDEADGAGQDAGPPDPAGDRRRHVRDAEAVVEAQETKAGRR